MHILNVIVGYVCVRCGRCVFLPLLVFTVKIDYTVGLSGLPGNMEYELCPLCFS